MAKKPLRRMADQLDEQETDRKATARKAGAPARATTTKKRAAAPAGTTEPTADPAPASAAATSAEEQPATTGAQPTPEAPYGYTKRGTPRKRPPAVTTARASTKTTSVNVVESTWDDARSAYWTDRTTSPDAAYNFSVWVSDAVTAYAAMSYTARSRAVAALDPEPDEPYIIRTIRLGDTAMADMDNARGRDLIEHQAAQPRSRFVADAVRLATHKTRQAHGGVLTPIPKEGLPNYR